MGSIEQTLVLIKPDGVSDGKIGQVIKRFEDKGLQLQGMKMIWLDEALATKHYQQHQGKKFFERLISYITAAPVVALVLAGESAIKVVRNLVGTTNPAKAKPGTIRGDLAISLEHGNIIHASDSRETAAKEIELFFASEEIFTY
ncbi:nucleoside diphosphate kinase [Halobacteroides halobius DSM 5150]|uniref:Nucleoside diphosphate kinase n=1 Tax=Halobacteroides halobius (strain ATCC 35273 / DSM 5150 / MD-1) TaxID=748449 RepID=L0K783_HALHC|nr:nucleoside-diphosphate kinase [Halobacteroides halobius]AGB41147.1 nucleoside diphosphate kinase [Halobacteroides halobius DSM 5150]